MFFILCKLYICIYNTYIRVFIIYICIYIKHVIHTHIHKLVQKWIKILRQEDLNPWPKVLQALLICESKESGEDVAGAVTFAKIARKRNVNHEDGYRPQENGSVSRRCSQVHSGWTARACWLTQEITSTQVPRCTEEAGSVDTYKPPSLWLQESWKVVPRSMMGMRWGAGKELLRLGEG